MLVFKTGGFIFNHRKKAAEERMLELSCWDIPHSHECTGKPLSLENEQIRARVKS